MKGHTEMEHYVFQRRTSTQFCSTGQTYNGDTYHIEGSYVMKHKKAHISFKKSYANDAHYYPQSYVGVFDPDSGDFSGMVHTAAPPGQDMATQELSNGPVRFTFRHIKPEVMRHRPSPTEFRINKALARWKFALDVALDYAKQELRPYLYATAQETKRRHGVQLLVKRAVYGEETTAGAELFRSLLPEDARECWLRFDASHRELEEQYPRHS